MYKISFFIILILLNFSLFGQDFKKHLRPESPLVEKMLRFDEMSLQEYIGKPNVSIPIYTIEEDGVTLPIDLSYNAGGIKVAQQSGWVGLGWDLSMSSIVQIVNDEDDFGENPRYANQKIERMLPDYPGWSGGNACITDFPMRYRYVDHSDGFSWTPTFPKIAPSLHYSYKIATDYYIPFKGNFEIQRRGLFCDDDGNAYDSEPDIFKANILGVTLNFIIDWEFNQFVVLNKKGYRVSKVNNDLIITNPFGEKYYFGNMTTSINDIASYNVGGHDKKISIKTYFLKKIETKNGKVIELSYQQTNPVSMPESNSFNESWDPDGDSNLIDILPANIGSSFSCIGFLNFKNPYTGYTGSKSTVSEPYTFIKKIVFPKGVINFILKPRTDIRESLALSRIEIRNNESYLVKYFNFQYDYFKQTDGHTRLKLNTICENGVKEYSFLYHTEHDLPSLNSNSQDCWGYYNGHPNNLLILNPSRYYLPQSKIDPINNKNNMSANFEFTQIGTLSEIKYPTGGKVEFVYELNTFDNYKIRVPNYNEITTKSNEGLSEGYGLRVKQILFKDTNSKLIKKINYEYKGGKSLLPKLLFRQYSITYIDGNVYPRRIYLKNIEESSISGYTGFNPLSSFDGVGYSVVIKKIIGKSSDSNERIETVYHNHPDITGLECSDSDAPVSVPGYKNVEHPSNGNIISITYFNNANDTVKKEEFLYKNVLSLLYYGARIGSRGYYCYTVYNNYYNPGSSSSSSSLEDERSKHPVQFIDLQRNIICYYPIIDFETLVTQKKVTEFNTKLPNVSLESYTYDFQNRLIDIRKTYSGMYWGTLSTIYDYPESFTSRSSDPLRNKAYQQMVKSNRTHEIVATSKIWNSIGEFHSYIKNDYIWDNEKGKVKLSFIEKRRSDNQDYKPIDKISYDIYDDNNNPVQIHSLDNLIVTYIWGYLGQYPIAEIRNATYQEVSDKLGIDVLKQLETSITPSETNITKLNNLRQNMPKALIKTFKYLPLVGITEIIDEKGDKISFQYDSSGRLISSKDSKGLKIKDYEYQFHK